jgi:Zn-dependent protease
VIILVYLVGSRIPTLATASSILQLMLVYGILLNLALCAFNLIPIPPLDGSHVMKYLLPPAWSLQYQRFGRQGMIFLFILIAFAPGVLNIWFKPVYALNSALLHTVYPYIIPSKWTT